MKRLLCAISLLTLPAACGPADDRAIYPVTCPGEGDYAYADVVVEAPGEVGAPSAVNEPSHAVDGVVEGVADSGSRSVFSRGLTTEPPNHFVVLRWSGRVVVDTEGSDFVIFENPFYVGGDPKNVFMDPAVVSLSRDGETWVDFPHDYLADNEHVYSSDPAHWQGFAGINPVTYQTADPACDSPFDAEGAGGDHFDLAELGDSPEAQEIRDDGFRFLRITSAATVMNPDTENPFPKDPIADGFDLDGVYARSLVED